MSALSGRRISDDLRYELADAARATEMSNRPRSLLVFATLLFVVAGIALAVTLRQREAAMQQYRVQTDRKATVENLASQFAVLANLDDGAASERNARIPDLFTRIEQAASAAGLRDKPPIPATPDPTRAGGGMRYQYAYTMQDPSLEALFAWVEQARERVPGLEVGEIEITPQAKAWRFKVVFVRWERPS